MFSRRSTVLALAVALLALAVPALAAPVPAGEALQLNVPSPYWKIEPAAAATADGGFLSVWNDMRRGIVGRFVAAGGQPQGAETVLVANSEFPARAGSTPYTGNQQPALVALADGGFLLLWTRQEGTLSFDYFRHDFSADARWVMGQVLTSAGAAASEPFAVSDRGAGLANRPAAAQLDGGRVAIAWEQAGTEGETHVAARLLDLAGLGLGAPVRVSTAPAAEEAAPAVAAAGEGFLVAWTGTDRDGRGVYARRYDAAGTGAEPVLVNQSQAAGQEDVSLAPAGDGGFLVAWQHYLGPDIENRIFGRFLGPQGQPRGDERPLSAWVSPSASAGALAALPDGGFHVYWLAWNNNLPQWIVAQQLDAAANPVGEPIKVSTVRPQPQYRLGVAVGAATDLVVWEGRDGRHHGIDGRTFALPAARAEAVLTVHFD